MSLVARKSDYFLADLDLQFHWYEAEAGWEVGWRYLLAVDHAVGTLTERPDLGRVRHFVNPELSGLRSCPVAAPFDRHLIFYRYDSSYLDLLRVMHGARDLPRRLRQPSGAAEDDNGSE